MIDRNPGRQSDPPAPVPHGVAFGALNKKITLAGVVVCRRNGKRVQMSALDVVLDAVAVEAGMEIVSKRSRIQERPGVPASDDGSEGEVHDPGNGVAGLRQDIAAEDVGGLEVRPQTGQNLGRQGKVAASHGQASAIDRSRGSTTDDGKRIAQVFDAWYLPDALEDPGLISAACPAAGHHQPQRVAHGPTSMTHAIRTLEVTISCLKHEHMINVA